ncbi:MAG: hypothetical protein Q9169_003365 [Polycauliona sp. 2 TL-2023]
MVVSLYRKVRKSARECAEQKDDDNKQLRENGSGDIEMQDLGRDEEEKEEFLPESQKTDGDVFRDGATGAARDMMDAEEAKEWRALGFYPASEFATESPKPKPVSALRQDTHLVNANGEGSSAGPLYSDGSSIDWEFDDAGIPLPDIPGAKHWGAERSTAETKLQKRNAGIVGQDAEGESSIARDQDAPLHVDPSTLSWNELRNAWKQDAATKQDDETQHSTRAKGKGKEREEEPEPRPVTVIYAGKQKEEAAHDQHQPRTPKHVLHTGIDLNTDYKFNDGGPFPKIQSSHNHSRKSASASLEPPPRTPIHNTRNENDIAYPYPSYPITPSPTPSLTSSTFSSSPYRGGAPRQPPPPPPPGPKPNFLSRLPFDPTNNKTITETNETTPSRAPRINNNNNFLPQTPPPAAARLDRNLSALSTPRRAAGAAIVIEPDIRAFRVGGSVARTPSISRIIVMVSVFIVVSSSRRISSSKAPGLPYPDRRKHQQERDHHTPEPRLQYPESRQHIAIYVLDVAGAVVLAVAASVAYE